MRHCALGLVVVWALQVGPRVLISLLREGPATATGARKETL